MKYFLRILRFLRLTDEQDNLSLTNIAVMLIIVKLALLQEYGLQDLGVLLVALLTYTAKKVISDKKKIKENVSNAILDKMDTDIKELKDKVSSVAMATGLIRKQ